jgi:hypothetical protein
MITLATGKQNKLTKWLNNLLKNLTECGVISYKVIEVASKSSQKEAEEIRALEKFFEASRQMDFAEWKRKQQEDFNQELYFTND